MKTLLTLFLLIPSLAWTDDIKYLVCFHLDEKINKIGIRSIGLKLNTNTKEYSYYHTVKFDGEYKVTQGFSGLDSDNIYMQNADYITLFVDFNDITIDRKNLEWWFGTPNNLVLKRGKCDFVDSRKSVFKVLRGILKDNLDLNKI